MDTEIISRVEISDSDELFLYLQSGGRPAYQYVYRAAVGVYWDQERGAFKFATKKLGEYAHWFAHMLNVVKSEIGLHLLLSEHTSWANVPEVMRISIQQASTGENYGKR
ncbi:hypothetical protein [Janthinobacterium sp.]|uniref:hypothetical protein n=1 Tax=Janthinobacterium sp. TaxID=1871054 RepID=UPI00293D2BA2|nr:hypothetical protein [Janthinobacterium sp.]